jgi:hypothetical protein
MMSLNGHETNGEMARRNLAIHVAELREMRHMMENAFEPSASALCDFDAGLSKLCSALAALEGCQQAGQSTSQTGR